MTKLKVENGIHNLKEGLLQVLETVSDIAGKADLQEDLRNWCLIKVC